jgi:hypothetical protein
MFSTGGNFWDLICSTRKMLRKKRLNIVKIENIKDHEDEKSFARE